MHLKYPKLRDFWTWDELGCLARAIGFQKELFMRNISSNDRENYLEGLKIKQINDMIDSKALSPDLHRTFNMHDAAYNMKVIQKSIDCLSNHYLSFQEINDARLAFQLYEHMDHAGLVISEHILQRTLKICGRAVSSLKLMQYIKHMDRLVPDRLMFYEFLDIILISEELSEELNPKEGVEDEQKMKDDRGLYKVCDFEDVLLTEDEKILERLNRFYKTDTEKIPVKKSKDKNESMQTKPWLTPSTIDHSTRELMVKKNKYQTEILKTQLELSNCQVLTRSNVQSCDCTQPQAECLQDWNMVTVSHEENNEERRLEDESSMKTHQYEDSKIMCKDTTNEIMKRTSDFIIDPLVTQEHVSTTCMAIEELQWKIATQGERMRQIRDMNPIKTRNVGKYSPRDAESDEKPRVTNDVQWKKKERNVRCLGDLIRNESPEIARRLNSRLKQSCLVVNESCNGEEEVDKLKLNLIEGDGRTVIPLEERLSHIEMQLDRLNQR